MAWRFYVYDVLNEQGDIIYVGKGSGNRYLVSLRERKGFEAHINAYFKYEKDSYAYETQRIAEFSPILNRHKGGNGNKATPQKKERLSQWQKEISKIGSRTYAAKLLINFRKGINSLTPKVDIDWEAIERIAYGRA